jgi:hypothetical protein
MTGVLSGRFIDKEGDGDGVVDPRHLAQASIACQVAVPLLSVPPGPG